MKREIAYLWGPIQKFPIPCISYNKGQIYAYMRFYNVRYHFLSCVILPS
jgi:hypothetical protein